MGRRHRRLVYQCQGHFMLAQEIQERRIEPVLVADFNSEAHERALQPQQEGAQPREKFAGFLERSLVEIWELQQERPKLFAEEFYAVNELVEFALAIDQHFLVRDDPRNLCSKEETGRRFLVPALHGGGGWSSVKRAVDLYRVEFRCVVAEIVAR